MAYQSFATRLTGICWLVLVLCGATPAQTEPVSAALVHATRPASIIVREHHDLRMLEDRVRAAVEKASRATVSVQVGRGHGGGFAFGSGVIVSEDGYVLTAAHVANRPNRRVRFRFADGRYANGITLGLHKDLDMGLMKIEGEEKWPYLKRAKSAEAEAGDWVIAIGYPGGFDKKTRPLIRLGRILKKTSKVFLTDCTLVGGDSGGPLIDIDGNVIGVHSRIGADLTTNLHVPVDRFADNWERLVRREVWGLMTTYRPWIGVEHDSRFSEARIQHVSGNGPAAHAGLRQGDTVIRFGGARVSHFDQLKRLVAKQNPGSQVSIQYRRNNVLQETVVSIGKKKSSMDSQTRDDADLLRGWLEQIGRRGRAIAGIGKNADQVKETFHDVLRAASRATVEVIDAGSVVAFGTIVGENLILTKASQLRGRELRCRYRNTRSFEVEIVSELKSHDLALLKSRRTLPPSSLRTVSVPGPGSLIASSGLNVWPVAVGVVSGGPAVIPSEGKLGIRMEEQVPRVSYVVPGSGAERAGLRRRDLIVAVDGDDVATGSELVDVVNQHFPGDVLRLTVQRQSELVQVSVELVRYSEFDEALSEFEDFIGGKLSARRTGFARVLKHDTAIRPVHCGGPVVDIQGRFVGINIARAARTTSYLLPADEVKLALERLKALRTDNLQTVDVGASNRD